jgi:hypothetical protein
MRSCDTWASITAIVLGRGKSHYYKYASSGNTRPVFMMASSAFESLSNESVYRVRIIDGRSRSIMMRGVSGHSEYTAFEDVSMN